MHVGGKTSKSLKEQSLLFHSSGARAAVTHTKNSGHSVQPATAASSFYTKPTTVSINYLQIKKKLLSKFKKELLKNFVGMAGSAGTRVPLGTNTAILNRGPDSSVLTPGLRTHVTGTDLSNNILTLKSSCKSVMNGVLQECARQSKLLSPLPR